MELLLVSETKSHDIAHSIKMIVPKEYAILEGGTINFYPK